MDNLPIIAPHYKESIVAYNGADAGQIRPRAKRPQFFWKTEGRGVPRYDDLMTARMLEQTHTARLPLDTVIKQVTTVPYMFRPTVDDPTPAHWDACDEAMKFFQGNYNRNNDSFDHFLKMLTNDVLSIDSGITELVPDEDGFLGEMYVRDGATFTKAPDQYGRLPDPQSDDPAYYQFSLPMHSSLYYSKMAPEEIVQRQQKFGTSQLGTPQPFTRSQIMWVEENPRSWSVYGRGRVQTVQRLIEIILNQDAANMKYFPENEVPEGLVNLIDANQTDIQRFRQYWKDEIKGQRHKVALVGGQVDWHPFRPQPKDLQFIESQKWYNKLCWMAMGLSQAEVGDLEQINRASSAEDNKRIFRKTTKPLLNLLQSNINSNIVQYMRPYHEVNGEIEFVFEIQNPEIEKMQREKQIDDLKHGLRTPNDVLRERGLDSVPWGDYPLPLFNNIASQYPEWVLEHIFEEEDPPAPAPDGFFSGEVESNKGDGNFFTNGKMTDKEALRNERNADFPPLKSHIDTLKKRVARVIKEYFDDDMDAAVEDAFKSSPVPETKIANIASAVGGINLVQPLLRTVLPVAMSAMEDGSEHHRRRLERRLVDEYDEPADIQIRFDVEDTMAFKRLKQNAAREMRHVNETIKDRVNTTLTNVVNEGGTVNDAIDALHESVDGLSENHSELIARTEVIGASRHGTQALCEGTDLIAGKGWLASSDGRQRPWHGAMDGVIVPKDQPFTVPDTGDKNQPKDYPRDAYVVGEDQPFNCRCAQQPVLREDMPDDLKGLEEMDGVKVVRLNNRMRTVYRKNKDDGERFSKMLERYDDNYSRNKAAKKLNISKPTYYSWLNMFDLK